MYVVNSVATCEALLYTWAGQATAHGPHAACQRFSFGLLSFYEF